MIRLILDGMLIAFATCFLCEGFFSYVVNRARYLSPNVANYVNWCAGIVICLIHYFSLTAYIGVPALIAVINQVAVNVFTEIAYTYTESEKEFQTLLDIGFILQVVFYVTSYVVIHV